MIDDILDRIISNDKLHALWLNTLSYLEYVGARKMMKSQWEEDVDYSVLEHMAEEIRHALILKKIARKKFTLDVSNFSAACMLEKHAAKNYFQKIDAKSSEQASSTRYAYLLTSYLIETRALKLYGAYQNQLKKREMFQLSPIINQEERHLQTIKCMLIDLDPALEAKQYFYLAYEEECFHEWLELLVQRLDSYESYTR
ncbi:MAG: hypothetical protein KC505_00835 [Myxococcales bacterium]|nr:hypothetical protein [Myxococcales bacterium]USN51370.1 MAG: hypothetical protein H6731_02885 [Myxococcales bacterium]